MRSGQRVLIHAAAGGVGHLAVQIAKARGAYVYVTPSGDDLVRIGELVDAGRLRVHVAQVLPMEEAAKAHELSESGWVRGKIVLTV